MNDYIFPIYLYQVDCNSVSSFYFTFPEQEIGRSDIMIHVEYGPYSKDEDFTVYNVWAQFANGHVRAYLFSDLVQVKFDAEDIVPTIMHALNSSEILYSELTHFIAHFEN